MSVVNVELARLEELQKLVDEQASDEGLWFKARTAPEAYLQQELRRLHRAIEGGGLTDLEGAVVKVINSA